MAAVDGGVDERRIARRGKDVAAPQVAVQQRRTLLLRVAEEVGETGEAAVPLRARAGVAPGLRGHAELGKDAAVAPEIGPRRGRRVLLRERADVVRPLPSPSARRLRAMER